MAGSGGSGATVRSAGCGKSATLTSGSRTIQSGGQSRSYILRIPNGYDSSHAYRLIFAYHWVGGTMQDVDGGGTSGAAWSYYGLREQADDSTIFVAPQGISNGWGNSGGQDLEFTDAMIELILGDLCVDTKQLYALGFSYGGSMTYAVACARPAVFRAVAVYAGGVLSGCEGGTQPVAYMGIHGISDGTLNISGGRSMRDRFVMNNGCTAANSPEPSGGSGMHVCTSYQGCQAGYPVRWCAFDGGHTPGNVDGGGDDGAKTWTKGEVWKFFTQFE
jgi:poly(3-hydroxybutyrate) depolymerase